ncbi:MAG TPA: cyclodeaminase/cyclohydrolase family protein [Candidatus Acidoferrales bacterium]|nr:cyclodeaminase/cyclohydrolase family protein [Candidatus Acidoferrales bacterium]
MLTSLSIQEFARKLASADPTPGGGSVAAAVGSFGAGLVSMVALLTANSPKHADVAERCRSIAETAGTLRARLVSLVDEDTAAFDRVSEAYRLPKSDDAQKARRSDAIQEALCGAIGPPAAVIELARSICDLGVELADIGNPNAQSDIGCAALCAQAAAHGAALNVDVNARSLHDRAAGSQHLERAARDVAQVDVLCEVILSKLRTKAQT